MIFSFKLLCSISKLENCSNIHSQTKSSKPLCILSKLALMSALNKYALSSYKPLCIIFKPIQYVTPKLILLRCSKPLCIISKLLPFYRPCFKHLCVISKPRRWPGQSSPRSPRSKLLRIVSKRQKKPVLCSKCTKS